MSLLRYCLVLLLAAAPLGGSAAANFTYYAAVSSCRWRPYICGGVSISYPFYLANDTKAIPDHDGESYYCGYPGLAITCEGSNKAVLKLGDDIYTVDYANLTVSLAAATAGNSCPSVNHNFISCSFGTSDASSSRPPKPSSIEPITCGDSLKQPSMTFVLPSRDVPPGDWSSACRQIFEVPVLRYAIPLDAQDPKWRNNGYGKALSAGFQLGWDRSSGECSRCEQSSGKCGYSQAGEFVKCFCPDGRVDRDGPYSAIFRD